MNPKIKNYIGFASILTLLALVYVSISFVNAYSKNIEPSSFRSFTVTGVGEVTSIPDVAQFTYSIISEGSTDLGTIQEAAVAKANVIKTFVKTEGVEKEDIKDTQYNVEPRYQYYSCNRYAPVNGEVEPCPPPEIVGYTIRQTTQIKVRDFEKIGTLLSGIVDNGANNVSQLSFTIDDPSEVQNEAREEAITKAKIKAQSIARAGGFSIGRLLGINENTPYSPYRTNVMYAEMDSVSAKGSAAPMIEPGSQEVTVNVTLTYEIQ